MNRKGFGLDGRFVRTGTVDVWRENERAGAAVSGMWRVIVGKKELGGGLMMKIQWLVASHRE